MVTRKNNEPMIEAIAQSIKESIATKEQLLAQTSEIQHIIETIIDAYNQNKKILICGNGGSAADAQHFAAELIARFKKERRSLPAIALTTDTSALTAIGNDYGFDKIFSRQVEGLGNSGDIFIGISTSGNSPNVIQAIHEAKKKDMIVITLLGGSGGKIKELSDIALIIPSNDTPRIQESHILVIHIICDEIEKAIVNTTA